MENTQELQIKKAPYKILDSFSLKIIAAFTMLLDHIGYIFAQYLDPNMVQILRIIGRVSFPLFAFLLVQGFIHTRDRISYLARIFGFGIGLMIILAILAQYDVDTTGPINIFMTLGLGFLTIWWIELYWNVSPTITSIGTIAMAMLADFMRVDYGAYGILIICAFYFFRNKTFWQMFSFALLTIVFVLTDYFFIENAWLIQIYALAAIPILLMYNGKRGKIQAKYFFYIFYPAHFAILYIIRMWLFGR